MDTLTLLFESACSLPPHVDEVVTTPSFTNSSHTTTSTNGDTAATAYLSLLPNEVLLLVASYVGVRGLGALAQTDRRLHSIAEDDSLWRELLRARFGCTSLALPEVKSWKLTFYDYQTTPRWHPTEKHPELAVLDGGLVVTTSTDVAEEDTGNRSIRAAVDYAPGSGLHYFEVTSLCPNDVMYHPYVGICSTQEVEPMTALTMWRAELCYAYAGNGTLYSSRKLDDDHRFLEKYHYGDLVGMMVDQRDKGRGWLQFYLNKKPVGRRLAIEGTWFPCVGTFHPRHVMRITVRPQLPVDDEDGVDPSTDDGQLESA